MVEECTLLRARIKWQPKENHKQNWYILDNTITHKIIIPYNHHHTIGVPAIPTVSSSSSSSLCQEHPCWNQLGSSFAVHRTTKADVRFHTRCIPNNNKRYYCLPIVIIRRHPRPMVPNPISARSVERRRRPRAQLLLQEQPQSGSQKGKEDPTRTDDPTVMMVTQEFHSSSSSSSSSLCQCQHD